MFFKHVIRNHLAFCHFLYLKIRESQLISPSVHVYSVTCGVIWKMGILAVSLPSAVLWGGFSILLSLDVCSSGSCVRDKVQQHMLCSAWKWLCLIGGWAESTIGSSPVTVFLTRNCSVRDTEIPMEQIERQQKVLDLTKLKSLLWQDSQVFFFCFNFV